MPGVRLRGSQAPKREKRPRLAIPLSRPRNGRVGERVDLMHV